MQLTAAERFGRRIAQQRREKSARDERDVLQEEIAAYVGVSSSTVGRWESGLTMPKTDDVLERLAEFFGVTAAWLRYGTGPKEAAVTKPQVKPRRERPAKGNGNDTENAG